MKNIFYNSFFFNQINFNSKVMIMLLISCFNGEILPTLTKIYLQLKVLHEV